MSNLSENNHLISPIHCFPPEILAEILTDCQPSYDILVPGSSEAGQLSLVCKYWRNVVLTMPTLWSSYKLAITQDLRKNPVLDINPAVQASKSRSSAS